MRQSILSIFFALSSIILLPMQGHSQEQCINVLSSVRPVLDNDAVKDLFQEMRRLEKRLGFREKLNGNSLPAAIKKIRDRGRIMVLNLGLHDAEAIISEYRQVFRDTEIAYVQMVNLQKQLTKLTGNDPRQLAEVERLQAEIAKLADVVGKNYTEYSVVRRVLEAVVAKNTEVIENFNIRVVEPGQTQPMDAPVAGVDSRTNEVIFDAINRVDLNDKKLIETAAYVLTRLGVLAEREAFPQVLDVNVTEIGLKEILAITSFHQFYRQNPQVIVAKLRQDLKREGTLLYKLISTSFLQSISRLGDSINRIMPAKVAKVIFWLAGVTKDQYVLDLYLDDIEEILLWRRPTDQKVHLLMDYSAGKPNDEMLVTFARIAVFSPGWVEIRNGAEKLSHTSAAYKAFYDRMMKAEETVKDINQLSLYSNKKWSAVVPTFLVSTAVLASEYSNEMGQAIQYLGSLVGLQ